MPATGTASASPEASVHAQDRPSRHWRVVGSPLEFVVLTVGAIAIMLVIRLLVVEAFFIPSKSMVPQLRPADKVLVSRLAYRLHGPHRGDLVVFDAPPAARGVEGTSPHGGSALRRTFRSIGQWLGITPRHDEFIKRVIALPGETVEAHDGHVFVNGELLLEPYLPPGTSTDPFPSGAATVPSGQMWVMGDNRNDSYDSRFFGPIRQRTVVGRAFLRFWPLGHVAFL